MCKNIFLYFYTFFCHQFLILARVQMRCFFVKRLNTAIIHYFSNVICTHYQSDISIKNHKFKQNRKMNLFLCILGQKLNEDEF